MGCVEWVGWPTPTWSGQLCDGEGDGGPLGRGMWERKCPWVSVVVGVNGREEVFGDLPGVNAADERPPRDHGSEVSATGDGGWSNVKMWVE